MVRLNLYCICGAKWSLTAPEPVAARIKAEWESEHAPGVRRGQEHGPCDAATAARHRRANDLRAWEESQA
jgi:hypothetical protein